jgi:hypothetical protein
MGGFRFRPALALLLCCPVITFSGCGSGGGSAINSGVGPAAVAQSTTVRAGASAVTSPVAQVTNRSAFVGAFYRPLGSPPFGIFSPQASQAAPNPYPTNVEPLVGNTGYCDEIAANGTSIDSAFPVDITKLNDIIFLGARWTRMPASQFSIDLSHIFGPGSYQFGSLDAAQCISYTYHGIRPVINLEAGPVQYDSTPGTFSPSTVPLYQTAADFGQWCGVVAAHEKKVFPAVTQYSLPGNEVNDNPQLFPGGASQIAAYSKACYAAVKAANPSAFVYGFELNMDGSLNVPAFIRSMIALGCGVGTCYDGIAMHLSLRYPIPSASTPCYPNPGGDYSMQCVSDVEAATGSKIHVLISETVYTVPGSVPNEQTKADATVAAFTAFANNPTVDGVLYANVDECALYPTGYFADGCLIDTSGTTLPAWNALQWFAAQHLI